MKILSSVVRVMLSIVVVMAAFANIGICEDDAAAKEREATFVEKYWSRIQNSRGVEEPEEAVGDGPLTDLELMDYHWAGAVVSGQEVLNEIVLSPDAEENIRLYVKQFGQHGPQADFRWLLADVAATMPAAPNVAGPPFLDKESRATADPRLQSLSLIRTLMAKHMTIRMLADRKMLDLYTQAVIWYGIPFDYPYFPLEMKYIGENLNKEEVGSDRFWWYAREFLVVAHAMGRDDLLKDIGPDDIKEKWRTFEDWFTDNRLYLRASPTAPAWYVDKESKHLPDGGLRRVLQGDLPTLVVKPVHPFPDWAGPRALPVNFVREFAD